jgi:hypothetical protein
LSLSARAAGAQLHAVIAHNAAVKTKLQNAIVFALSVFIARLEQQFA